MPLIVAAKIRVERLTKPLQSRNQGIIGQNFHNKIDSVTSIGGTKGKRCPLFLNLGGHSRLQASEGIDSVTTKGD